MQSPDLRRFLSQNPYRRKGKEITYLAFEKVNYLLFISIELIELDNGKKFETCSI